MKVFTRNDLLSVLCQARGCAASTVGVSVTFVNVAHSVAADHPDIDGAFEQPVVPGIHAIRRELKLTAFIAGNCRIQTATAGPDGTRHAAAQESTVSEH